MDIKLSDIHPGQRVQLLDIPQACPLKKRLGQFGVQVGMVARCRYVSPGRHLAALEFGGTVLALRLKDLEAITVRLF